MKITSYYQALEAFLECSDEHLRVITFLAVLEELKPQGWVSGSGYDCNLITKHVRIGWETCILISENYFSGVRFGIIHAPTNPCSPNARIWNSSKTKPVNVQMVHSKIQNIYVFDFPAEQESSLCRKSICTLQTVQYLFTEVSIRGRLQTSKLASAPLIRPNTATPIFIY